jgi:chromosome segregation ATPase
MMMTDFNSPTTSRVGKRRIDAEDEYASSPHHVQSFPNYNYFEPSNNNHKQRRFEEQQFEFDEHQSKRRIETENLKPSLANFNNPSDVNKFLQSQLTSAKVESSLILEKKDKEIASLKSLLSSLTSSNNRLVEERSNVIEENSLLKKAVQILDKKQKDSSQQVNDLTSILQQAKDYIGELERQNRNLNYHLELLGRGNSQFDQPPPDVY